MLYYGTRYHRPLPRGVGTVTSRVGPRISPIKHVPVIHDGVDIGAPQGTPIYAVDGGIVSGVYYSNSGGNVVQIDAPWAPLVGKVRWLYLHMMAPSPLRVGDRVTRGDTVGYVGSTGDSTGPHLHLEANRIPGGKVLNPITLGVPV